jgi:methionyl-tRNA formyltransferase
LQKTAVQLEREVRAYLAWPRSYTTLASKEVIITQAHAASNSKPKDLALKTSEGYLIIDRIQPAGKKEMTAQAFMAGHKHLL